MTNVRLGGIDDAMDGIGQRQLAQGEQFIIMKRCAARTNAELEKLHTDLNQIMHMGQ